MTNTFKQMAKDGTIKRADASKIRYEDIHVEPGFNLRDLNDPDFVADMEALVAHMARGGRVPDLEVRPRDEGGVWLVDGHRRHMAYGRLIEQGQPIEWISIVQFVGNDAERTARVMTSQEGRKLKPLEIAEGYRRLTAFGLSPDDIARRVCKTRQHVDQMLILANAPHAVHQAVKAGDVSATEAVKVTRQHGDKAAGVIEEAKAKAGKGKVTAKALKPWTPPAKVVAPLVSSLDAFVDTLPKEAMARLTGLDNAQKDGRLPEGQMVSVDAAALLALMNEFQVVVDARAEAKRKARDKQAQAAQGVITEQAA